jgi:hypothetical protein
MSLDATELLALVDGARRHLERLELPDTGIAICTAALARMEKVLARPPRVAILGEINSGKTSVADLLLGVGLLPASVVANTRHPVLMKHGDTTALYAVGTNGRQKLTERELDRMQTISGLRGFEVRLPSPRLLEFEILDTPGLAEGGASDVDADVFIWCTVATRAWTESERSRWAAFPERCRRNGLLVATHRDALQGPTEVTKIERRLRTVASSAFRDLILVSASEAPRSRGSLTGAIAADQSGNALLERIREWVAEISERRARKAERIIRRLARLTFHQLAQTSLRSEEAGILKSWEIDSARLLGRLDYTNAEPATVIRSLLFRFAQSLERARPGAISRSNPGAAAAVDGATAWPMRHPAARRYARLMAADLTALLRIELARTGLRDASMFARYATARSILLALANLDAVFDDLGQLLAASGDINAVPEARSAHRVSITPF